MVYQRFPYFKGSYNNVSLAQVYEAEEALSKNELVSIQNQYNLVIRDLEDHILSYGNKNLFF